MIVICELNKVPCFDVGVVLAGAYAGWENAKGIEGGKLEKALVYGPTIAATVLGPVIMLAGRFSGRRAISEARKRGSHRPDELDLIASQLETQLSYKNTVIETGKLGIKTAIETAAGYALGYIVGKAF